MSVAHGLGAPGLRSAFSALILATLTAAVSPALADTSESLPSSGPLTVYLDQAQAVRMPDKVATLVVGNPLIADVSIQTGGLMVITGKGFGTTNLLAFDRAGNVLAQALIQVQGPRENIVVVYRGAERESYSCMPTCERRITLGDGPTYFDAVVAQTGSRNGAAQGAQAAPGTPGPPGAPGPQGAPVVR
jgi:hypothetical protein